MTWLLKLSPALRWAIGGVLLIIALAALYHWLGAREEADDRANQNVGAAVQREANQAATIDNARKADHAEQELRRDPVARDDECMRYATNPDDC
jgi:type II secretory pathway pseudopilin PulG